MKNNMFRIHVSFADILEDEKGEYVNLHETYIENIVQHFVEGMPVIVYEQNEGEMQAQLSLNRIGRWEAYIDRSTLEYFDEPEEK